jgi:hypothetical protein
MWTWKHFIIFRLCFFMSVSNWSLDRAIPQAVSRWLPTAAARVHARSGHVGFVVDKVALGQVFSEYFDFPCQSSFHQILHPHNHLGTVQQANWWATCRVNTVGLHPPNWSVCSSPGDYAKYISQARFA